MRVALCVDALEPKPGGIGRYTWELCQGLAGRKDVEARYVARSRLVEDPSRLLQGDMPPRRRRGFRKVGEWLDQRTLRGNLVHGPNYFLPDFAEKGLVTIHDLSVFRYPETHPAERVRAFEREFEKSLGRAAHVIADTETVRRELIDDFGVSPERVTAVALGVDCRFRPLEADTLGPQLAPFQLQPKGYALCVSTLEPRKKIAELVATWRRLPAVLRARYPLVLAGGTGWRNEQLHAEVGRGMAEGWLRHLGFVDEADLPALYAGAALFIYPSIYEGFGLPPIEAMASGTPVIVSSRSCMPEVCGGAASYIDPEDPDQMLESIVEGLSDNIWQAHASKRGIERASGFTWDRCIDATVSVYHRALSS